MERYKSINNYLNMALLESEIKRSKNEGKPLSLVLFKYNVDLDNAFFFKKIIVEIYELFSYAPIFYNDKDSFLVSLNNKKLYESIALFKKLQHRLQNDYDLKIDRVGITEVASDDTFESVYKRVSRYFVVSKRLPEGKIIYGTSSFDFYNNEKREDTLKNIIKQNPQVILYSFYKKIPIKEQAIIAAYNGENICLKTTYDELLYLRQNEKFLYVRHKEFPYVIKGSIYKYDFDTLHVCIKDLEFQDISIVDKENARVTPPKSIRVMIEYQGGIVGDGMIEAISVDSVAIKLEKSRLKKVLLFKNSELILKFKLFSKNSIAADNISLRATIFGLSGSAIIFLIKPNNFIKTKIANYVKSIQDEIIKNLKKKIITH